MMVQKLLQLHIGHLANQRDPVDERQFADRAGRTVRNRLAMVTVRYNVNDPVPHLLAIRLCDVLHVQHSLPGLARIVNALP